MCPFALPRLSSLLVLPLTQIVLRSSPETLDTIQVALRRLHSGLRPLRMMLRPHVVVSPDGLARWLQGFELLQLPLQQEVQPMARKDIIPSFLHQLRNETSPGTPAATSQPMANARAGKEEEVARRRRGKAVSIKEAVLRLEAAYEADALGKDFETLQE